MSQRFARVSLDRGPVFRMGADSSDKLLTWYHCKPPVAIMAPNFSELVLEVLQTSFQENMHELPENIH